MGNIDPKVASTSSNDQATNDGSTKAKVGSGLAPNVVPSTSFANMLKHGRNLKKINFRPLVNENRVGNHDTVPKAAMESVLSSRYEAALNFVRDEAYR
ncbi:hypothetical protein CTI12_AA247180 [Artemisia annua]|uniref:Uncharacterized protein n=1 Tax=Artemisia annua TaxID=35608 RepID=A0A2U1NNB1_ARTAN|nr:hypothetical protein CTI12_AA247180 [Artemisia annua]